MNLPILNLSNLSKLSCIVIEQNAEKLSQCMQTFAKHKDHVRIVTNEQTVQMYETFQHVQTVYDPEKYDYLHGSTYIFDNCFADDMWRKDTKLLDFISYPRMLGITTVFGFQHFPAISPRMCWNLDMICVGTTADKEKIYDRFLLYTIMTYDTFCELLDTYTKEDRFLVLRREGTEDRFYYTRLQEAPQPPLAYSPESDAGP